MLLAKVRDDVFHVKYDGLHKKLQPLRNPELFTRFVEAVFELNGVVRGEYVSPAKVRKVSRLPWMSIKKSPLDSGFLVPYYLPSVDIPVFRMSRMSTKQPNCPHCSRLDFFILSHGVMVHLCGKVSGKGNMTMGFSSIPPYPPTPEKEGTNWTDKLGAISGAGALILAILEKQTQIPWMVYVFYGVLAVFSIWMIFKLWTEMVAPLTKQRKAKKHARALILELPETLSRLRAKLMENGDSLPQALNNVRITNNNMGLNGSVLINCTHSWKSTLGLVEERLKKPVRSLDDIRLIFGIVDRLLDSIESTYRDSWRPFIMKAKEHVDPNQVAGFRKAIDAYTHFITDYLNYRNTKESEHSLGQLYHHNIPDPLP